MKNKKLLMPLVGIAALGATVAPVAAMTSCSCGDSLTTIDKEKAKEVYNKYLAGYVGRVGQPTDTSSQCQNKEYTKVTFDQGDYITKDQVTEQLGNQTFEKIGYENFKSIQAPNYIVSVDQKTRSTSIQWTPYVAGYVWDGTGTISIETVFGAVEKFIRDKSQTPVTVYQLNKDEDLLVTIKGATDTYFKTIINKMGYMSYMYSKEPITILERYASLQICNIHFHYSK